MASEAGGRQRRARLAVRNTCRNFASKWQICIKCKRTRDGVRVWAVGKGMHSWCGTISAAHVGAKRKTKAHPRWRPSLE